MAQTAPALLSPTTWAWLDRLGNAAADLLFPPHCAVCRRYGSWLCPSCRAEIEVIHPPLCYRCGLPIEGRLPSRSAGASAPALGYTWPVAGERWICRQCRRVPPPLDGVRAFAFLGGPLRAAILEFKYHGLRRLAPILGTLMGQGWDDLAPEGKQIDAIVPVPLHPSRQRERGFNQAALLARELAVHLECPVIEDVLERRKPTTPQVGLGPAERRANVSGAFRNADERLTGACVLLVDDVYTTGSTLEAACSAMRGAGVRSVWAYTLARAGLHSGGMSHINVKEAG